MTLNDCSGAPERSLNFHGSTLVSAGLKTSAHFVASGGSGDVSCAATGA